MADLFAPKLRGEPSYERPVQAPREAPTYFEGIAKLGEMAIGAAATYEKAQARQLGGRGSGGPNLNLVEFSQDIQTMEKIGREQGLQARQLYERQVAKKFAAYGIEFDSDFQSVYETTTGRPWAGYGRDINATMMEEQFNNPEVQTNYLASFVALPSDASDEERLNWALGQQAELKNAERQIVMLKTGRQLNFDIQGQAAYDTVIQQFISQNLGAMKQRMASGQIIGAQDIANLNAEWAQMSVGLSRPAGVSDDQWKSVQDKIDNVGTLISTFEKATSSEVALEQMTMSLVNLIENSDGGTPISRLVTQVGLIKDPTLLGDFVQSSSIDVLGSLAKASENTLNITRPQLFGSMQPIVSQPSGQQVGGQQIIEQPEIAPEIASRFEGMTPQQTFNNLRAGGNLAGMVTPNSLNRPEAKDQFESAAYGIGLSLRYGGDDDFLSKRFLQNLVGNKGFINNVEMLDKLDPEAASAVKQVLTTGLGIEAIRQGKNLASIERSVYGAEWNGTSYDVDVMALEDRNVPSSRRQAFIDSLDRYYGGDLVSAARDGFKKMGEVTDVLGTGGFYNLSEALDRRDALIVIENTKAGLQVGVQEAAEGDEIGSIIEQNLSEGLTEAPEAKFLSETQPAGQAAAATPVSVEAPRDEASPSVILALGTNDYSNPQQAADNTRQLIRDVRSRGGTPVIVPPNVDSEQFKAVADAIIAVANEEGVTVEMAQYDPRDPLHMTMAEAKRISGKYAGARVVGDSNAVRIAGMQESDLTKTGAGTRAILEAFGKSDFGSEQPVEIQMPEVGVKLPNNIEPEFVSKAVGIANRLGIKNPDDLFTVMSFETVGKMTSDIRNPRSGAVGLIQFTNIGIRGLGVTKEQLARMDRIEQLDYVEKYFEPYKGKMKNLGDVYMAVFAPVAVGKPDSYPLYKAPTQAYEQNREMDTDRDGIITRGDAIKKVSAHQNRIKL